MEKEDYLETIYKLKQEKGYIRVSDIAEALKITKPSVSQMCRRLEDEGCLICETYKPIQLTKKGQAIGKKIADRHEVLEEFLSFLQIPAKTREKDIHGMEHCLSEITLKKLKELTIKLRSAKN